MTRFPRLPLLSALAFAALFAGQCADLSRGPSEPAEERVRALENLFAAAIEHAVKEYDERPKLTFGRLPSEGMPVANFDEDAPDEYSPDAARAWYRVADRLRGESSSAGGELHVVDDPVVGYPEELRKAGAYFERWTSERPEDPDDPGTWIDAGTRQLMDVVNSGQRVFYVEFSILSRRHVLYFAETSDGEWKLVTSDGVDR